METRSPDRIKFRKEGKNETKENYKLRRDTYSHTGLLKSFCGRDRKMNLEPEHNVHIQHLYLIHLFVLFSTSDSGRIFL